MVGFRKQEGSSQLRLQPPPPGGPGGGRCPTNRYPSSQAALAWRVSQWPGEREGEVSFSI